MRTVWRIVFGLVTVLGWSSTAAAFEDKLALGAGAGYALAPQAEAAHGVAVDVQAGLGLSETWQLRAGGTFTAHPDPSDELFTGALRGEILYLIDIVDIVPFGGIGLGGFALFGDEKPAFEPAAHVALGAAYWLSFDWLLQLDVRAHVLPFAEKGERGNFYFVSSLSLVVVLER